MSGAAIVLEVIVLAVLCLSVGSGNMTASERGE